MCPHRPASLITQLLPFRPDGSDQALTFLAHGLAVLEGDTVRDSRSANPPILRRRKGFHERLPLAARTKSCFIAGSFSFATSIGVWPAAFRIVVFAPYRSSRAVAASRPFKDAICRGVSPKKATDFDWALGSAPALSKASMTSVELSVVAIHKAVSPWESAIHSWDVDLTRVGPIRLRVRRTGTARS